LAEGAAQRQARNLQGRQPCQAAADLVLANATPARERAAA
jgi:hypothetical protein